MVAQQAIPPVVPASMWAPILTLDAPLMIQPLLMAQESSGRWPKWLGPGIHVGDTRSFWLLFSDLPTSAYSSHLGNKPENTRPLSVSPLCKHALQT